MRMQLGAEKKKTHVNLTIEVTDDDMLVDPF
jgi:hypothetical protein